MKYRNVFFAIALIITLLGVFIGKVQRESYQVVLTNDSSVSNVLSDENGIIFLNSFEMELKNLEFETYSSGACKQIIADVLCTHNGKLELCKISINHPARYHQYNIYIKDYWPSKGQTPAGVRLWLVKQPAQWMVYFGLILLMATSLWAAFLLVKNEFSLLLPKIRFGIIIAFAGTAGLILLLNPMMRGNLPPILRSVWFYPHIFFFILSYALLLTSFVTAWMELKWNLDCSYFCFRLGIFTYTIGLALGMIWAKVAWGDFWGWDPKETAALITWATCQIVFHYEYSCKELTPKKAALLQSICFLCLLLSWFGVQLFKMGGLHVY